MLLSELAGGQQSVFPGLVEVYDKIVRPAGGEEAGSAGGVSCQLSTDCESGSTGFATRCLRLVPAAKT